MSNFLEERLPIDVRIGMSYADDYEVAIVQTASGAEYRKLVQPFPTRSFHVNFTTDQIDLWNRVLELYHRAYGKFAGFRVKCLDDFSTNGRNGVPGPNDEPLQDTATGIYQLRNFYGVNGTALAGVGYPCRNIYKPVAGTVVVAKNGTQLFSGWTVDNTTGLITFTVAPLLSDHITAGCYFDIPCRFNSAIEVTSIDITMRDCGSINIIELLQP